MDSPAEIEIARARLKAHRWHVATLVFLVLGIVADVAIGVGTYWTVGIVLSIALLVACLVWTVYLRRKALRLYAETDRLIARTQAHLDALDARLSAGNPHWRDGVEAPFGLRWNDSVPPPPDKDQ
jgi:Flp pilus assembly protein TadB